MSAVRDIANVYKWPPQTIMALYLDNIDMESLFFWDEQAELYNKSITNSLNGLL